MESNPSYVLSCHDAEVIDQHGHILEVSKLPIEERRDFTAEGLKQGGYVLSVTMCWRNVVRKFPVEYFDVPNGDTFLTIQLGEFGACKFHEDIKPASYRRHFEGLWSMKPEIIQWRAHAKTYEYVSKYFRRLGDKKFSLYYLDLLVKKQLEIVTWEKQNQEQANAEKTIRHTLKNVLMMKGFRSFLYVRKRFKTETN